jgi:hypothetical protein
MPNRSIAGLAVYHAYIVHDRTLLGGIDSFLKELVHVRPFLVSRYEPALEGMAERWLDSGGANLLVAVDSGWLWAYIQDGLEPATVLDACKEFFRWAVRNELVEVSPLESFVSHPASFAGSQISGGKSPSKGSC